MRWDDLDETTRLWRKPKTKYRLSHMVPLPLQVMEAIQALSGVSEWVFPGMEGKPRLVQVLRKCGERFVGGWDR